MLLLIFLSSFFISTQSKILRVFPHYTANFVIVDANYRLMANCIKNTTVENAQGCVNICIKTEHCTTINYHKRERICELFNTSKFDGVGILRKEANWVHYETDDDANLVGPVCTRLSPCKSYQVCEGTYRMDASYVCKCKEGFAGDQCEVYNGKGSSKEDPAPSCKKLMKRYKGLADGNYYIRKRKSGDVTSKHCIRYMTYKGNDFGTHWKTMEGSLIQISVADGNIVGVNSINYIFIRTGVSSARPYGSQWKALSGQLKYVSVGDGKIVGVNSIGQIFFTGIHTKIEWKDISESLKLKQISVGDGKIMGVDKKNQIWFRTGVSTLKPYGTEWKKIYGGLKYISVGDGKIIGVGPNDQIWFRTGLSSSHPEGTVWKQIDGTLKLKQIEIGNGKIVGVNSKNQIYIRIGIDATHPYGTGWKHIPSGLDIHGGFKYITVGDGKVMGISKGDHIYYRYGL